MSFKGSYLVVNALNKPLALSARVFLGAISGPILSGESSMMLKSNEQFSVVTADTCAEPFSLTRHAACPIGVASHEWRGTVKGSQDYCVLFFL